MARRPLGAFIAAAALISTSAVSTGCEPEIPRPRTSVPSNVAVPLPPSPELVRKPYDRVNADGTLTVEGLLRERDKQLGETVSVSGVVKKLVVCPEVPPEPAPEPPPPEPGAKPPKPGEVVAAPPPPPRPPRTCSPPPHFFLVDKTPVSKRELLVYGSMWSVLPTLKEGQEVSLVGQFDIVSKDGVFLRQAGLLILDDLPEVVPQPEPTPTPAPN